MNARNRVLTGIFVIYVAGIAWLLHGIIADLEPRYREAAEEPLVDTARILAALISTDIRDGTIDASRFEKSFSQVYRERFLAQIYSLKKSSVDLRVYVTDQAGTIIFDSAKRDEGRDYSQWRDVKLTLAGKYGARTTRDRPQDPDSTVMFVAAPVVWNGKIIGALAVGKPTSNLSAFAALARQKIVLAGLSSLVVLIVLALLAAIWLTRPVGLIRDYLRLARDAPRSSLPHIRRSAIGIAGAAYDDMRDVLAGRNYVEEYVQALTHEIKSPLSAIRGAAELLTENMDAERRARFIDSIRNEALRIQTIVDRLLELSELENRETLTNLQNLGVDDLLSEVAQTVAASAEIAGITVATEERTGTVLRGDKFLLHRALVNLMHNAIDFSPRGGTVSMAVQKRDDVVVISIKDQGPGIPDYALARVWDRFYSLPRAGTGLKSTGLGLSFVKEIMKLHRGDIALRNQIEGGLIVVLTLPLAV